MKKYLLLIWIILFLAGISSTSFGRDLELLVKNSQDTEEGVKVTYSVKNERGFTRPNIRIAFKVLVNDKPIACKLLKIAVPANATGEQDKEVIIPASCKGKSCKLDAQIFGSSTKTYRITNWMKECPR